MVSWHVNSGVTSLDGPFPLHVVSHPPSSRLAGLVHMAEAASKTESRSIHLRFRLGTGPLLILLQSSGQNKPKGQPRFGGLGGEIDSNLGGAAKSHYKGQGNRKERIGAVIEINQSASKTACIPTTNFS